MAHIKELNNAVPEEPVVFLKPPASFLLQGQGPIVIPRRCNNLHHEVELGVVIGIGGKDIAETKALSHISSYFVALDMTSRELQGVAKKKGLPWTVCKGYDTWCPVSESIPKSKIPDPQNVHLWCKVNGQIRHSDNTNLMITPVAKLIAHVSSIFTLLPGDCILTGTPEGVGPVVGGDVITCGIQGLPEYDMEFKVVQQLPASM